MVRILWELLISTFGVGLGFFIGENFLRKLGFENKKQKIILKISEIPEYLKNKFLVNSAIINGEKKRFLGLEEAEVLEMRNLLEQIGADEMVIFRENDCKYALKYGKTFLYVRGRITSLKDLSEIWEVVHRSFRGVEK